MHEITRTLRNVFAQTSLHSTHNKIFIASLAAKSKYQTCLTIHTLGSMVPAKCAHPAEPPTLKAPVSIIPTKSPAL